MNKNYIIVLLVLIVLYLVLYCVININENFSTMSEISNEAIQNVASVYNSGNMTVTNQNVTNNLTTNNLTASSFNLLPRGIVVAWAGTNIPNGWLLCDGTNGTPDLRSRFVIGSGQGNGLSNYAPGANGGEEMHTLSINEIPPHNHSLPIDNACFRNGGCDARQSINPSNGPGTGTMNAGGGQPHNNMPPYYALAYIMKS